MVMKRFHDFFRWLWSDNEMIERVSKKCQVLANRMRMVLSHTLLTTSRQ